MDNISAIVIGHNVRLVRGCQLTDEIRCIRSRVDKYFNSAPLYRLTVFGTADAF